MRVDWRALRHYAATPWTVLAAFSTGGALVAGTAPLTDPDLPWHLLIGQQILDRHTATGLGSTWSFNVTHRDWITTQWLSEACLTCAYKLAGLRGVTTLRVLLTAALVVSLSRLLLSKRCPFWGPIVLLMTLVGLVPFLTERPQLASLPLLAWLSRRAWGTLSQGEPMRLGSTVAVTWFWANLHGLWVMLPLVLGLLITCALLDRRPAAARRLGLTLASCLGIACLTPAGPSILTSPFRFAAATRHINEWQATVPRSPAALVLDVVTVLFIAGWIRARTSVPRHEVVYVGALLAFALLAFRNLAPALILLAPALLQRLETTFPRTRGADSERERQLLLGTSLSLLVAAVAITIVRLTMTLPFSQLLPDHLARQVAADGLPHKVLNDYNVGGILLLRGEGRVRVAIDGRADYYGERQIDRYFDLLALKPGWQRPLEDLDPDRALLRKDAPLTGELLTRGWPVMGRQGDYVLLARPH